MSAQSRDGAERLLDGAVALLPEDRRDWGRAMRAELAGIEPAAARRQFAAGCARAALSQPAVLRSVGSTTILAVTAIVAVIISSRLSYLPIRLETCALTVVIVGLAYAGRRTSALGPVAPSLGARMIRGGAYAVIGFGLIAGLVSALLFPGNIRGESTSYVLAIALYLAIQATMLAATARGSRMPVGALAIGVGGGVVGALAWFVASMLQPTFAANLDAPPWVALVCALVTAVATMVVSSAGPVARIRAAVAAALVAAGSVFVLVSFLATAAMTAFTSRVPDIVGPVMVPGSTHAQKLAEDMIEVGDYYAGALIFGGIAFAALGVLISATRARTVAVLASGLTGAVFVAIAFGTSWPFNIYTGAIGVAIASAGIALSGRQERSEPSVAVDLIAR